MSILSALIIVVGLSLFELVSSIDNAVINAEVLSTMGARARRWFLRWGILIAVFVVRGLLPWLIVWAAAPALGPLRSLTLAFSNDPSVAETVARSAPYLLTGGGVFLVLLFLHWLFLEHKNYGLPGERFLSTKGVWFYAVASIFLLVTVSLAIRQNPYAALAAVVGSTAFFITHGFKQNAEAHESKLVGSAYSDIAKLLYLEAIDTTFSIDGVLGAFAFTLSVPLILLGNGAGALVVRAITVGNIERIKSYPYLKNGAMYSILVLGSVMLAEGAGLHLPEWISPLTTFLIVGGFFLKSRSYARRHRS
ncbi:MAG TPA: DUF475 domain-containing protein [Rectinemataceae bacterium]|nr:DUF475 domain-containing protein [Rectinemataceae bacterium]